MRFEYDTMSGRYGTVEFRINARDENHAYVVAREVNDTSSSVYGLTARVGDCSVVHVNMEILDGSVTLLQVSNMVCRVRDIGGLKDATGVRDLV
jgi:hypothetical protein